MLREVPISEHEEVPAPAAAEAEATALQLAVALGVSVAAVSGAATAPRSEVPVHDRDASVLAVVCPGSSSRLRFADPRGFVPLEFPDSVPLLGFPKAPFHWAEELPCAGRMVAFPAWLRYTVDSADSDADASVFAVLGDAKSPWQNTVEPPEFS